MRPARISAYAMLCSLVSLVWFTSGLAWANEAPSVKPEPESVPAPLKPHGAASDTKSPGKGAPPARTGSPPKPIGVPHLPPTMVGKDGAPMVLVPAGEFIMGSTDDIIPASHSQHLASLWAGPVERVMLEGFGHNDLDVNPRYGEAIHGFLQRHL